MRTMLVAFSLAAAAAALVPAVHADEEREDHEERGGGTSRESRGHDEESEDESGEGAAWLAPARGDHDVRVRARVVRVRRHRTSASISIEVRGSGLANEAGVQLALFAGDTSSTPLWTGTADVASGQWVSLRADVALPRRARTLVASATLPGGVADARPSDNVYRVDLKAGRHSVDALAGAVTYSTNCAACHGADGGGGSGPSVRRRSAGSLLEAMREGEDEMPAFPDLDRQDARDMVAFLRDPAVTPPAPTPTPTPTPTPAPGATPTWSGTVQAILVQNCTACHQGQFPGGNVSLDTYAAASSNASRALSAIQSGKMPPGGPLPAADVAAIQQWIAGGRPQ